MWQQAGFKRWRLRTRATVEDRTGMEKAEQYHQARLLSKALKSWSGHHLHHQTYEVKLKQYLRSPGEQLVSPTPAHLSLFSCYTAQVMRRQGAMLLRLKVYQKVFAVWQVEVSQRTDINVYPGHKPIHHFSPSLQTLVSTTIHVFNTLYCRVRQFSISLTCP